MERPTSKLHEAVSALITDRLKIKFAEGGDTSLTSTVCTQIYQMIFDTVIELFEGSQAKVSNEVANYIAQEYYDSVLINGKHPLDPNIFTQRAKLENINTEEIKFLAVFFKGTDYFVPVFKELKKRT